MRILHSADWHLDTPFQGRTTQQTQLLRRALLQIPGKIVELCREQQCDMMLLSGDLFDTTYTGDSLQALKAALTEVQVPVFITPGNHDYMGTDSPWLSESWPENVRIFTRPVMEVADVPQLNCRVYGAGFTDMDCPSLLEGFHAEEGVLSIGILHGDPTQPNSPYNPVTQKQAADSGLAYLALGHIHKGGQFRAGGTLCAWPGCPMGRGYDEQGEKGVLIVDIGDTVTTQFIPLDTPRFYDREITALPDAATVLQQNLPPVGNEDFYRFTFTGESEPIDLSALAAQFSHFPNLLLRDKTVPPPDIWRSVGEDSFEGYYFKLLLDSIENKNEDEQLVLLAARISRQILDGQEVVLP